MGKKKIKGAATPTGPVLEAQKALVLAHVDQAHDTANNAFSSAREAAIDGDFLKVETIMGEIKTAANTVLEEAARFAEEATERLKAKATKVEYDEGEKPKRGRKSHDDDADDDDDDY